MPAPKHVARRRGRSCTCDGRSSATPRRSSPPSRRAAAASGLGAAAGDAVALRDLRAPLCRAEVARLRSTRRTSASSCAELEDDAPVGVFNLSEIVRGAFQSAYLGYYAFAPHAGQGYMSEGLDAGARRRVSRPCGCIGSRSTCSRPTGRRFRWCGAQASRARASRVATSRSPAAGATTSAGRCWSRTGAAARRRTAIDRASARRIADRAAPRRSQTVACASAPDRLEVPKVVVGLELAPYAMHEECVMLEAGERIGYRFRRRVARWRSTSTFTTATR